MAKKRTKRKRIEVHVGDLVMLHTNNHHMTGTVGIVTHLIGTKKFVWKAIGPNDFDYFGSEWVAFTKKPTGVTKGGSLKEHYRSWVVRIMVPVTPPKPKPKKIKPVKLIQTKADLHAALTDSTKGHKLVVDLRPDLHTETVQIHPPIAAAIESIVYDDLADPDTIALSDEERALRNVEGTDGR